MVSGRPGAMDERRQCTSRLPPRHPTPTVGLPRPARIPTPPVPAGLERGRCYLVCTSTLDSNLTRSAARFAVNTRTVAG